MQQETKGDKSGKSLQVFVILFIPILLILWILFKRISTYEDVGDSGLDDLIERLVMQKVEGILEKIDSVVERVITRKLSVLLSKV